MTENTLNASEDNVVVDEVTEAPAVEAEAVVVEEAVAEEPVVVEEVKEVVEDSAVILAPEPVETTPAITSVENGVIGSGKVSKKPAAPKAAPKPAVEVEKVAILASRSVHWQGLGKVQKGYNIVSKEDAEKWVTLPSVRLATPEEIKTYLG